MGPGEHWWIAGTVVFGRDPRPQKDIAKKQFNPVGQAAVKTLSAAQAAGADETPTLIRPLTPRSKFQRSAGLNLRDKIVPRRSTFRPSFAHSTAASDQHTKKGGDGERMQRCGTRPSGKPVKRPARSTSIVDRSRYRGGRLLGGFGGGQHSVLRLRKLAGTIRGGEWFAFANHTLTSLRLAT